MAQLKNPVPTKQQFIVWIMKKNIMAMNFEPHECDIYVPSMKIRTHENKAICSIPCKFYDNVR